MDTDIILKRAVANTVSFSQQIDVPLQDIICRFTLDEMKVTFLFLEIKSYGKIMSDTMLKDRIMEAFIHDLTINGFEFGERPRISFSFSVAI